MDCKLCPHACGADRITTRGLCHELLDPRVSKSMAHMWEEPPISGNNGSGAVFFTGCNLRCAFCQNHKISQENMGEVVSIEQLAEIFLELQSSGVHNINLVTPTHFVPQIAKSLELSKKNGLTSPIVYNSNGYELVETLKILDGLVDIYLPDLKYFDNEAAMRYSNAENYFNYASKAILEMQRQQPQAEFDNDGIMRRGLIIRHLVLPKLRHDSMRILDWIAENAPTAYVSLMAQYVPLHKSADFPEINRRITTFEYNSVVDYFFSIGLTNGFVQERKAATTDYIPDF